MTDRTPTLMGIVNVTPDSFSDGGRFDETALAVEHALKLATEGAHILDIGGESTRPGAAPVTEQEELDRVIPVVEALSSRIDELTRLSIDTRKPAVAEAAIAAGAHIWNDVSALTFSGDSVSVAAKLDVPIVLMHAQGDPRTMQESPRYNDVVADVLDFLMNRIAACVAAGISKDHLIADPGIGFGKTLEHNLALLGSLADFEKLDVPILLGASRKRFIAALDREGPADERLGGSLAAVLAAWRQGVTWFRVHDVAATRQALAVTKALETRR
ncbi:MAG: dihydropteroate synthase [Pseudomonadota bacterium]